MEIVVCYEEASKNGDMSALNCFKPKNNDEFEMVVGTVSNEADEIFKIVSKQGYLKNHDSALIDKVAERIHKKMCSENCGERQCVDAMDRCVWYGYIDEAIAEMKAEVEE